MFEVSSSSYFLWQKAGPSDRWKKNEALLIAILDVFETSKGSYGSPRMTKELRALGYKTIEEFEKINSNFKHAA